MKITKKNLKDIELYLHPKQKEGWVQGYELYQHLKDEKLLDDCLTLENLEEIQNFGLEEFNKYFKNKYVFGWNSVRDGDVPYLCGFGGEVVLHWYHLDYSWNALNPALRRKSSEIETKPSSEPETLDLHSLEKRIEKLEKLFNPELLK